MADDIAAQKLLFADFKKGNIFHLLSPEECFEIFAGLVIHNVAF